MRPCNTRLLALLGLLLLAGCDQILLPPKPTPTPSVRLTEFPVPTHYPSNGLGGITVGPDGTLWFTEGDGNRIGRITPTGLITEFRVPAAGELTAWPDGKLWFTWNAPQVGRLTPAGVVTTFLLPRSSNEAAGITAGPDGTLWFTELFANKLGCITPGGRLTEFPLPAPFTAPSAITVGADHRLWFLAAQDISAITSRELLVRFTLPH